MTVPAHVPADLVYTMDIRLDEELKKDPIDYLNNIARQFPNGIYYTPKNGGHWVISGYQALCDAARKPDLFSSRKVNIPPVESPYLLIPINIDPPAHGKYRQAIAAGFSPAKMRDMEGYIREFSINLIEAVKDKGGCDFVHAVAEPLPITIFMQLVGLPVSRLDEFRGWAMSALSDTDPAVRQECLEKIVGFMTQTIEERRVKRGKDMISDLFDATIDGRPLTMEEMQAYCLLFFLAGLDTVVNGMSFGVRHFAQHPELQQQIRDNPEIIPAVVEEALRRYSFVNTARQVTRDCEFHGVQMKEGEMVMLCEAAADLDPEAFANPLEFDITRKGVRHVAFNTGPHSCLGAHLARIELGILYEEWCKRIPEFRIDENTPPEFVGGSVMGMRTLHLKW